MKYLRASPRSSWGSDSSARTINSVSSRLLSDRPWAPASSHPSTPCLPRSWRAFVVHAAASECIEHEPRASKQSPPEGSSEQDRYAQVMPWTVIPGNVAGHRTLQTLTAPFDCVEPVVRQANEHGVELPLHNFAATTVVDQVESVPAFLNAGNGAFEFQTCAGSLWRSRRGSISVPL